MRRLWALLVVCGACGFEHGAVSTPDASRPVDGAITPVADAMIDGLVACSDDDADGICNSDDDWPCGVKPAAPAATVSFQNNNGKTSTTVSLVVLDGSGRLAVASPNETLALSLRLQITDTACSSNCIDQLEVGWVTGSRTGCLYDDPVSKQNGVDQAIVGAVTAPGQKQVYDLRVNLGQNTGCFANGANSWWNAQPPDTRTIAKLCVH